MRPLTGYGFKRVCTRTNLSFVDAMLSWSCTTYGDQRKWFLHICASVDGLVLWFCQFINCSKLTSLLLMQLMCIEMSYNPHQFMKLKNVWSFSLMVLMLSHMCIHTQIFSQLELFYCCNRGLFLMKQAQFLTFCFVYLCKKDTIKFLSKK